MQFPYQLRLPFMSFNSQPSSHPVYGLSSPVSLLDSDSIWRMIDSLLPTIRRSSRKDLLPGLNKRKYLCL